MKFSQVAFLTVACILGLMMCGTNAQYYLPYYVNPQRQSSGFGNGGFLALIGLLIVILFLFGGFNTNTSTTGGTTSFQVLNLTGK